MNPGTTLALILVAFAPASAQIPYPSTPRADTADTLHGTIVPDPYRWLEELDSPETRAWIDAQNGITGAWLSDAPRREWMRERLEKLWHYDKYGLPRRAGGRVFYTRKSGLENQGVLYWHPEADDSDPRVLLDPNALSSDGTIALSEWSVSEDGRHLAYALSEAGSDWITWRVREVATGTDLPEVLEWSKFSGAEWSRDGQGFYYGRYDAPEKGRELEALNYHKKLCYHRLGTPQAEDRLVYDRPDEKEWGFHAIATEDQRYLVIIVTRSASDDNALFHLDLAKPDARVVELVSGFDASWNYLGNDGTLFYLHTTAGAPNGRIVSLDIAADPDPARPRVIVPETEDPLESASLFGNRLVCTYQADVVNEVRVFDLEGRKIRDLAFPVPAAVYGFEGRRDDTETFYSLVGNTTPHRIYRYDLASGEAHLFRAPEVDFDPDDFVSRQVFYQSKDGTRIPMFISHHRDTPMDGNAPAWLYGYGGFNISLGPYFSVANVLWMEMGGVCAVANLRGGGEYGERWHEAGMKENKQNVFDDFIAAAEYLVASKVTSREKLAIGGGSNGGLLVGACINQRPDLFGAAVADVGVHDMLRFHKFTIGWAWIEEFGDPGDAADFTKLLAYSPYHNIQTRLPYPATLIVTADHDDRVFPAHSFKYGAALQHAQARHGNEGVPPVLLRIETKAGHGAGKPTAKHIEEIVDRWSFLAKVFELE